MEIHSLQELDQALQNGMVLAIDDGTVTSKVDVTTIEKHAIESYAGSTLAGSAQSVKAALDRLVQKSLPTEIAPRTTIASGDDLNSYTSPGIYRCATASIAASLSNCPISNVGFNLDVAQLYNVAFAYQRITTSTGATGTAGVEVYERFINVRDSLYGTWKKVPTRAEVDELSAVTTGTLTPSSSLTVAESMVTVRQVGKVVTVNGYMMATIPEATNTTLGVISGVSLPKDNVRTVGACGANAYTFGSVAYIGLTTAGNLVCHSESAGQSVYFNFTYIVS